MLEPVAATEGFRALLGQHGSTGGTARGTAGLPHSPEADDVAPPISFSLEKPIP